MFHVPKEVMQIFDTPYLSGYDVTRVCNLQAIRPMFSRINGSMRFPLVDRPFNGLSQASNQSVIPLQRAIQLFQRSKHGNMGLDSERCDVHITLHRIRCVPNKDTKVPALFHNHGIYHPSKRLELCGLLCVSHENITGGIHAFHTKHGRTIYRDVIPGELFVFQPHEIRYDTGSSVSVFPDLESEGYMDLIVFEGHVKI